MIDKLTILMWKARIYLFGIELFHKHMRRKYCHKGFHKTYTSYVGYGGSGQRMKYIRFLKCKHCNYIFFASANDKKRYLKMQDRERFAFRGLLSCSKDEALLRKGCDPWEEVSSKASDNTN